MTQRNFEEERKQAQQEAERLTNLLQYYGYEVGSIDLERAARLAYVPVNGVELESVLTLAGYQERGQLLEHVRYKLLEAKAQELLQNDAPAASWKKLALPSDIPTEIRALWRVHLGEDDTQTGVNIAEIVRDDKRSFVFYAGGPQPGYHAFYVDKISPKAIQTIREAGGSINYHSYAQRADEVAGRRQVQLPEGTQQFAESEENMAPQRFRMPNGAELRLVPQWYTVELDVATIEQ